MSIIYICGFFQFIYIYVLIYFAYSIYIYICVMLYTSYYISCKCKWYCTVFAYHVYIYIYLYMYICASKKTWGGHLGLAVLKFGLTVSVCIIIGLQGDTWWWLKLVLQLVVVINNDSVLWYSCNMLQYIYTIPFLTTCNIYDGLLASVQSAA